MGSVNDHIAAAVAGGGSINDKLISLFSSLSNAEVGHVRFGTVTGTDWTVFIDDVEYTITVDPV